MALHSGIGHPAISALCATCTKHLQRVSGVPYCTSSSLLPIKSFYLPLLDELCCRTATFTLLFLPLLVTVFTTVNWVVKPGFLCCSRYDVTDIPSVTIHMVYADSHTAAQLRASALLLLELLFIREGFFSCSFFKVMSCSLYMYGLMR